jgi:sialidase-1
MRLNSGLNLALAVVGLFSIICPGGVLVKASGPPMQTNVFVSGQGGYHTYRIPSLVVTKKKTLLAFCEGRKTSAADNGDIDLLLKRSHDAGQTWGALQIVHEEGGTAKITIGNPCPVVDQDTGTIWLPFCRDNKDVFVTHSSDDGRTWAKPRNITKQVKKPDWTWYATGPGIGIQMQHGPHKGRLIIPCDHSEKVKGKPAQHAQVFYSDDHGKTWKLGGTVAPHTDECQVVELSNGSLLLNMRNYWGSHGGQPDKGNRRALAWSKDGGQHWSDLQFDRTLIEPICQASLLRYTWPTKRGKNRLVFSNPASTKKRHRLTVRLSYDEGKTWPLQKMIYKGSAAYSCLATLPDRRIGLLYERDESKQISFTAFSLQWLTVGKDRVTE